MRVYIVPISRKLLLELCGIGVGGVVEYVGYLPDAQICLGGYTIVVV